MAGKVEKEKMEEMIHYLGESLQGSSLGVEETKQLIMTIKLWGKKNNYDFEKDHLGEY